MDIVVTTATDDAGTAATIINKVDLSSFRKFGFQSDAWYKLREEKISFLLAYMHHCKDGKYVVSCDPDFHLPPRLDELAEFAQAHGLDYYGLWDGQYKSHFFMIKCNEMTRDFMQTVLNTMKVRRDFYAEQSVINQIIHNAGIRHGGFTCSSASRADDRGH